MAPLYYSREQRYDIHLLPLHPEQVTGVLQGCMYRQTTTPKLAKKPKCMNFGRWKEAGENLRRHRGSNLQACVRHRNQTQAL